MFSLRRHLMLWLSGALALGACGLALMTYAFALDELNEVFDEQLRQVAFAVLEHALPEPRSPASRPAPEDLVGFDLVTQVWSLQGERIFLSDPQVAIPFSSVEGFQTVRLSMGDWRVYTDRSARHLIQAAQAVRIRERVAANVALKILVPSLSASPALAIRRK